MSADAYALAVVALPGESDSSSATRIRSELGAALEARAPVVVDLSHATFVDSAVVGVLLDALAEFEEADRPLLLLVPDDSAAEVNRLFELTGLAALLPVVRTWDEAMRRVRGIDA